MIKVNSVFVPFWFTPESESNQPEQTRFLLRGLTGLQKLDFYAATESSSRAGIAVRHGLLSWANVTDADGKTIWPAGHQPPEEKDAISMSPTELMNRLSEGTLIDLANAIITASKPTAEEKKD
jgi:hypothetical protein